MNEWFRKILADEAPGGPAERLSVVAPSVVAPGEPFDVRLAALDEFGYPSIECDGAAVLADGPADCNDATVAFEAGMPAARPISGVSIQEPGMFRLPVEFAGDTFFSNPIKCERQPSERIFWGDPHVHTVLSDCHPTRCRSLDFCYIAAREVAGLDWVCPADHVSNGRGSVGKWQAQRTAARVFNDPPTFTTLLGYEASLRGGCGGDNNVYFADDADQWVDEYEDGDVRSLSAELSDYDCIIVPHHTTRTGKHGELTDRLYLGRTRMPVVEIHSKWGTSEYRGNPNPLDEVHPGPGFVQDFLQQGYPLGFIGGTDTHATMPAGYGEEHLSALPGMTAVRAPQLTRGDIFGNIRWRNCYATSAERIILEADIAGARPGIEIGWSDPNAARDISATSAAESDITAIDVVRNGETIHSVAADDWRASIDWTDDEDLVDIAYPPRGGMEAPFVYYYIRVTCSSGAQAWTSPVWLLLD